MTETSSPKISVIMPVYNGEKYLSQAIESVLSQSYSDFEFIIINDFSTDRSESIIGSYHDSRIIFLKNEENLGITRSLNLGIKVSRGEYIARMDADDISLPERFKEQVSFLDSHPDIGVLGTAAFLIDGLGNIGQEIRFPQDHILIFWQLCFFTNAIIHPSAMMRKDLLDKVNGYNVEFKFAQDYNLWCRLSKFTHFANLPHLLLYLRKHAENVSVKKRDEQEQNALTNSNLLISEILQVDIPSSQLQSASHAVSRPTEAVPQDYFLLAHLKYRTGSTLFLNMGLPKKEKQLFGSSLLIELVKLSERVNGYDCNNKLQEWIDEVWKSFYLSEVFQVAQTDREMLDSISFQCPTHQIPLLRSSNDKYTCPQGCTFPITGHIPRFTQNENQTSIYSELPKESLKVRLDSLSGKPINFTRVMDLIGNDVSLLQGKHVLEIGCGPGSITEILLQLGESVIALDQSDIVNINYDNFNSNPNYAVIQTDITKLPFTPAQFDVILCNEVFSSIPYSGRVLEEIVQNLKSGGALVLWHRQSKVFWPFRTLTRWMLKNVSHVIRIQFCKLLAALLMPIHQFLWKHSDLPLISKIKFKFFRWSPVNDYFDFCNHLPVEYLHAYATVDIMNNIINYYDGSLTSEIITQLSTMGMEKNDPIYIGNDAEIRVFKSK
jgi:glycosyltransferase involved in cell wall biosynthesis/SAM-dependent methyltransferase